MRHTSSPSVWDKARLSAADFPGSATNKLRIDSLLCLMKSEITQSVSSVELLSTINTLSVITDGTTACSILRRHFDSNAERLYVGTIKSSFKSFSAVSEWAQGLVVIGCCGVLRAV